MSDLFERLMDPTMIHCDNTSCIRLFEEPVFHGKTKHINNKYHYIRELVQNGVLSLQYISIDEHVADILMKSLPNKKLVYLRDKLGLIDISSLVESERYAHHSCLHLGRKNGGLGNHLASDTL